MHFCTKKRVVFKQPFFIYQFFMYWVREKSEYYLFDSYINEHRTLIVPVKPFKRIEEESGKGLQDFLSLAGHHLIYFAHVSGF